MLPSFALAVMFVLADMFKVTAVSDDYPLRVDFLASECVDFFTTLLYKTRWQRLGK